MCDRKLANPICSKSPMWPLLEMAQQIFLYQTCALPSPCELLSCPLKSSTTTCAFSWAPERHINLSFLQSHVLWYSSTSVPNRLRTFPLLIWVMLIWLLAQLEELRGGRKFIFCIPTNVKYGSHMEGNNLR